MASQLINTLQKYWKPATSTAFTVVTLLAFLFFGALFYLYVSQNYSYLIERNFRLLATWSTQLQEKVENYQKTFLFRMKEQESEDVSSQNSAVKSRGLKATVPEGGLVIAGYENAPLVEEGIQKEYDARTFYETRKPQMADALKQLPGVRILQTPETVTPSPTPESPKPGKDMSVTFELVPNQRLGTVQANVSGKDEPIPAGFSLGTFFEEIATEKIFDDVIFADPQGSIVFQRNPSTLQFLHLGNLLHHQRADNGWLSQLFQEGGVEQKKSFDPQQLLEVMKSATPAHFQIIVGGNSYDVFMQAVHFPQIIIPGQKGASGSPWIICGLLPSSDFQEQYLAIPFTVLLFCLFLLISAFLALPLISLIMMNPRERLTRFSIVSLLLSSILGAGIGTLFLLDLGLYRHMVDDFHDRLENTAHTISEAVHIQLDRMLWQLDWFDKKIMQLGDLESLPTDKHAKAWLARYQIPDPCLETPEQSRPLCYPDFSVMFWVDPQGTLRETWTQQREPYVRGIHDLGQRDYVAKLQHTPASPLYKRFIDNRWMEYYAQPLISLESSTRSLVLSIPHRMAVESSDVQKGWVAAIQSEAFSLLLEPVLSPETGYAVIDDRSGLVLFHSNERRMLRENFLEETDSNPEIAALIYARAQGSVEGDYWGIGHRFFVKPLSGLPWTLVVFESKETFRTINFDILIFSLCLFTLYILGLLLWSKLLSAIYRYDAMGRRVRWTWPKQISRSAYHWLTLGQAVLFFLGLTVLGGLDWQNSFSLESRLGLVGLPFLTIWIVIRVLWKRQVSPRSTGVEPPSDPWTLLQASQLLGAFSRFALTTFLLLGVFPAIVFFKVAHDQEMRLFIQHHLWEFSKTMTAQSSDRWMAKGLGDTPTTFTFGNTHPVCLIPGCQGADSLLSPIQTGDCPGSALSSIESSLHYAMQGIFNLIPLSTCPTFTTETWNPQNRVTPSWFNRLPQLIRKSSLQNPMNKESWGFLHHNPIDSLSEWNQVVDNGYQRVSLRLGDFQQGPSEQGGIAPIYLSVWVGLFPWTLSSRFLGLLIVGSLLLGVGYLVLRYMVGKIFPLPSFFHQSHEAGIPAMTPSSSTLQHLLILGNPGSGKSEVIHSIAPECFVVDLHATNGQEAWAAAMLTSIPEGRKAIVLDHFEYRWEDTANQQEKGILVERLLSGGYQVCILSTRDPLEWTKVPWSGPNDHSQEAVQAYWIDLLGTFGFTYFVPSRMPSLMREWLHSPADHTSPTGALSTLAVKQSLLQESQPTIQLERIGRWIRSFQEWATWTPCQMIEQFLRIGWPYYLAIWQSCSLSEKLTLFHLALDGYLHADNPDLTSLSQKGLVRLEPDLQLMNESFRKFVLQLGTNFHLSQWEQQATQDTWGRLKWPFLMIFGIIILFFFFTQQEFKNSFITLISLLPILLPALPELPVLFSSQKTSSPSQS
ncbi:MAG: cache domain-containing protein [Nitrospirales bacterium]